MMPLPEAEASEETYAKMTAELKARIVDMWGSSHGSSERKETAGN
jgi:hypothetical protein